MSDPTVTVLLDAERAADDLVAGVRRGLGSSPRRLAPLWLYDDGGSGLFDEITRLEEYYPTEAERSILISHGAEIAAACDATTIVELGSGTSDKTRTLLDAFDAKPGEGRLRRFVPLDVSEGTLRDAADMLTSRYPDLVVEAVVADFTLHLAELPANEPGRQRMVAFLGGTVGNLYVEERAAFLGVLADSLDPGDWLLLGTDLVKPVERIVAAYDDSRGVTARFVRNSLAALNRRLGADFDLDSYSYAPLWDARLQRMDLRLRADSPQRVRIPGADLDLDLQQGEEIQVEISSKFHLDGVRRELADAGFTTAHQWTDEPGDFALTLARVE